MWNNGESISLPGANIQIVCNQIPIQFRFDRGFTVLTPQRSNPYPEKVKMYEMKIFPSVNCISYWEWKVLYNSGKKIEFEVTVTVNLIGL